MNNIIKGALTAQRGALSMETTTTTIITDADKIQEQIENYSRLIDTYGASAVIIAVFIVILVGVLVYILRNNQKTNNQLIDQQRQMVEKLMEGLNRQEEYHTESKKEEEKTPPTEPNLVKIFLKINSSIKEIIRNIYDDFNASRIAVYVFHNGVYSSHGLPFFKISCISEIVRKNSGVIKHIDAHASMPLQMFDNSISYLSKHGHMLVEDSDDDNDEIAKNSPVLCGMLKGNNIKSAAGIALYDNDDNILGILIVEFNEKKDIDFLEKVEKELIEKSPSLAPILAYSGIYNTTSDATNN
jgi:hypothetical protein